MPWFVVRPRGQRSRRRGCCGGCSTYTPGQLPLKTQRTTRPLSEHCVYDTKGGKERVVGKEISLPRVNRTTIVCARPPNIIMFWPRA